MMKNLLKTLFVGAALTMSIGTFAKEDITATYLKNADLSVDPNTAENGWVLGNNWRQDYQKATDGDHVNVVEFYAGWGSLEKTEYSMRQTVTLPAGDYRLAVNAFYRQGNDGNGTNNNMAWIFAGEKTQNVYALVAQSELWAFNGSSDLWKASNAFSQGKYSNEFDFSLSEETTFDLGFEGKFNEARCWVILGPVKLYAYTIDDYLVDYDAKYSEAVSFWGQYENEVMNAQVKANMEAAMVDRSTLTTAAEVADAIHALNEAMQKVTLSIAAYQEAATILNAAESYDQAGQDAYKNNPTIADLQAAYDNCTLEEITDELKAEAKEALAEACRAQVEPNPGCDMTALIVNPAINGADGWTTEKPFGGNGPMLGGTSFEYWAGNSSSRDEASFDYWQEIEVPNGKYIVGADMYNSTNGESGAEFNASCGVYGSSGALESISLVYVDGTDLITYVTDAVNVINGKLRIGVKSVTRMGARWFVADNFTLTYAGKADYLDAFVKSLEEAKALLADDEYSIVTGEERAVLEAAVAAADAFDLQDEEQFEPLSIALGEATEAFIAAYPSYKTLKDVQASLTFTELPYADEYYALLLPALLDAEAYSAEDALSKADELKSTFLLYIESNGMAAGVSGAVDATGLIENPNADDELNGWTQTLGENSGGSIVIRSNEPFVDASGKSEWNYFDGGDWGATAWNVSFSQDVLLPSGKYYLTVCSRAAAELTSFNLFANDSKVEMRHIGAGDMSNGDFGRGWNDNSLEFSVDKEQTVKIGVQGITETQYNWMSFTRFRLIKLDGGEITTGINAIAADTQVEAIYNLAGQRVKAATKGLYIINGKKVMVK